MRIAIIGTRGIPNHYGGFEQFAEYLSQGLVELGMDVWVYNSHNHPYQEKFWNGVNIIHKYDPEVRAGTAGQFIYDLNCILDTRIRNYDIILQLGYTSSSIWGWLLPSKPKVITNMDGLEWKRTKYSKLVQRFLQYAEKLGVVYSDSLIADSLGIQKYLKDKYNRESDFIPYGADLFTNPEKKYLEKFHISAFEYNILIARLEPENSIEKILDGVVLSDKRVPFLVIGNHSTKFGKYLKSRYKNNENIKFVGGIYNIKILNNLRFFSNLYFHGHTVGGTNPSLLEAMASQSLICAHNNVFNKSILDKDAFYFDTVNEVSELLIRTVKLDHMEKIEANCCKIKELYSWSIIVQQYFENFQKAIQNTNLRLKSVTTKKDIPFEVENN